MAIKRKLGIIGAGNIGGILLLEIAARKLARTIGIVDIKPPAVAAGKALDVAEGTPIINADINFVASRDFSALEGCECVINTAGVPRAMRPDGTFPSREELLATNLSISDAVAEGINTYCPDACLVNIANPLDAIVYRLHQKLKKPKHKISGMAGVLDTARYRLFIAQEAGVSVENVEALVLGGHGDTMVPIRSCTRIAGMPVEQFITSKKLDEIEDRVRKAGGEVVSLLGSGSAFVSPCWAALEMMEALVHDKKKILPVAALLEGEYGVHGLFVGVPAILGRGGVEKIVEVRMTPSEKEQFKASVEAVRQTAREVDRMGAEMDKAKKAAGKSAAKKPAAKKAPVKKPAGGKKK
ncbi:MAG: malate dehydrogenase [Candidatus Latescibacteria bacterium]|nr:malate dehydrogenase [Candidatus Latescibacterota bacterium]